MPGSNIERTFDLPVTRVRQVAANGPFYGEAVLPSFHDSASERKSPERRPRSQHEPRVANGFREIDAIYFRDGEIGKDQLSGLPPKRVHSALAQNRSIAEITKHLERTDTETGCPRAITRSPPRSTICSGRKGSMQHRHHLRPLADGGSDAPDRTPSARRRDPGPARL